MTAGQHHTPGQHAVVSSGSHPYIYASEIIYKASEGLGKSFKGMLVYISSLYGKKTKVKR